MVCRVKGVLYHISCNLHIYLHILYISFPRQLWPLCPSSLLEKLTHAVKGVGFSTVDQSLRKLKDLLGIVYNKCLGSHRGAAARECIDNGYESLYYIILRC